MRTGSSPWLLLGSNLIFLLCHSGLGVDSITNNVFLIARVSATGSSKEKSELHFHFFLNKCCGFPPGEVAQAEAEGPQV